MESKYEIINKRIEAASEEARKNKGIKSKEEINADFFKEAIALFDEFIAGDITLADGRKMTIPTI